MENKEIYGNQCGSDNAFTKKARLLQSIYRVEIGEEEGVGPTKTSKQKYGNMISGGEVSRLCCTLHNLPYVGIIFMLA